VTGTLQDSSAITYSFNSSNITSYDQAGGCAASCHDDGATWNRRWIGVADAKPAASDTVSAAVCDNCHGSFRSNWKIIGETNHVNPDSDNDGGSFGDAMGAAGAHPDCAICHGWGNANYAATWGSDHGNNLINMNGEAGYQDAGGQAGECTSNCHGGYTNLALDTNSGWTVTYGDYGAGGCNGCHGYPPMDSSFDNSAPSFYDDASSQDYNFGGGSHTVAGHIDPTVTASDAWTPCRTCHMNEEGSHTKNTGELSAGTNVTVAVTTTYQIGPSAPSYNGSVGPLPTVGPPWKTCDNVSCHYGLSPDWAMRSQAGGDDLTISDGTPDPAGHIIDASGGAVADTVIDYLDFSVTGAGGSLTAMTVNNAGTASSVDVTAFEFWYDNNGDAGWDGGDTLMLTANPSGSVWAWSGNESITASTNVLVTADVSASATDNVTIRTSLNNGDFTGTNLTISGAPFVSNLFTVSNPATCSTVTSGFIRDSGFCDTDLATYWPITETSTSGTFAYSGTTHTVDNSGSLYVGHSQNQQDQVGYAGSTVTLNNTITSSSDVSLSMYIKKTTAGPPDTSFLIYADLVYSDGSTLRLWTDTTPANSSTWDSISVGPITVISTRSTSMT
jgi:hypothetical protein